MELHLSCNPEQEGLSGYPDNPWVTRKLVPSQPRASQTCENSGPYWGCLGICDEQLTADPTFVLPHRQVS